MGERVDAESASQLEGPWWDLVKWSIYQACKLYFCTQLTFNIIQNKLFILVGMSVFSWIS